MTDVPIGGPVHGNPNQVLLVPITMSCSQCHHLARNRQMEITQTVTGPRASFQCEWCNFRPFDSGEPFRPINRQGTVTSLASENSIREMRNFFQNRRRNERHPSQYRQCGNNRSSRQSSSGTSLLVLPSPVEGSRSDEDAGDTAHPHGQPETQAQTQSSGLPPPPVETDLGIVEGTVSVQQPHSNIPTSERRNELPINLRRLMRSLWNTSRHLLESLNTDDNGLRRDSSTTETTRGLRHRFGSLRNRDGRRRRGRISSPADETSGIPQGLAVAQQLSVAVGSIELNAAENDVQHGVGGERSPAPEVNYNVPTPNSMNNELETRLEPSPNDTEAQRTADTATAEANVAQFQNNSAMGNDEERLNRRRDQMTHSKQQAMRCDCSHECSCVFRHSSAERDIPALLYQMEQEHGGPSGLPLRQLPSDIVAETGSHIPLPQNGGINSRPTSLSISGDGSLSTGYTIASTRFDSQGSTQHDSIDEATLQPSYLGRREDESSFSSSLPENANVPDETDTGGLENGVDTANNNGSDGGATPTMGPERA